MQVADFDYPLPEELIADRPPPERTDSRLMVVDRSTGGITHHRFADLPALLARGDLLVLNDTRVIPARIFGTKRGGGARIEILLLEERAPLVWECLAQRAVRLARGVYVDFGSSGCCETVEVLEGGRFVFRFDPKMDWEEFLRLHGEVPLPPYILKKREGLSREELSKLREVDIVRYQTTYAESAGSAAAPTAGLHFTPSLFERLKSAGILSARVTLHVGMDTFSPVSVDRVEDHRMKSEWCLCPKRTREAVQETRRRGGRVIAVGTTTCRTLESYARRSWPEGPLRTDLFLKPGDDFRAVDSLVTNFHLPKSTLLMLVSAFMGNGLRIEAYRQAMAERYRFYSYGDAMLIL